MFSESLGQPLAVAELITPVNLVKEATNRCAISIQERFDQPDCPPSLGLREALELLETSTEPLYEAMSSLAMLPEDATIDGFLVDLQAASTDESKYQFSSIQLHKLNRHPYARTIDTSELSQMLGVSSTRISWVAKDLELRPLPATNKKRDNKIFSWHGYFNLDQVASICNGVEHFDLSRGELLDRAVVLVPRLDAANVSAHVLARGHERPQAA